MNTYDIAAKTKPDFDSSLLIRSTSAFIAAALDCRELNMALGKIGTVEVMNTRLFNLANGLISLIEPLRVNHLRY